MAKPEITKARVGKAFIESVVIYAALAVIAVAGYSYAAGLIAVQTPWINVVMGKASANIVLALALWTIIVESIGKKRNWRPRRIWTVMLCGMLIMVLVVHLTPLP